MKHHYIVIEEGTGAMLSKVNDTEFYEFDTLEQVAHHCAESLLDEDATIRQILKVQEMETDEINKLKQMTSRILAEEERKRDEKLDRIMKNLEKYDTIKSRKN